MGAALAVLDRFMAALNACNEPALLATLHFPHYRLAGGRMRVWDQSGAYLGDFLGRAGADWHHSEWDFRKVIAAEAAADHAKIGDPHVNAGLVAGDGGALIWPQLVGFARAKEYLFTGDLMTSVEAERIGLINHVVPADQLDDKVYGLARRLAGGAMRSIRWTKQVINVPLRQLAHSMMDLSLSLETQSNLTKDHQEAVSAFAEKRRPKFTGR